MQMWFYLQGQGIFGVVSTAAGVRVRTFNPY